MTIAERMLDAWAEWQRQLRHWTACYRMACTLIDVQTGKIKPFTCRMLIRQEGFHMLIRGKVLQESIEHGGQIINVQVALQDMGSGMIREEARLADYEFKQRGAF